MNKGKIGKRAKRKQNRITYNDWHGYYRDDEFRKTLNQQLGIYIRKNKKAGKTMTEIADELGISRVRCYQILKITDGRRVKG